MTIILCHSDTFSKMIHGYVLKKKKKKGTHGYGEDS